MAQSMVQHNTPLDTIEKPAAKFVFKYRSKGMPQTRPISAIKPRHITDAITAALIAELVIPREATPEPAAAPRRVQVNVDELSIEELRDLARTQAAQLENGVRSIPYDYEDFAL